MDLKYIVVEGALCDEIIIFSNIILHADIAKKLGAGVISAGFIKKDWTCYGESVSLKLKSRPVEDTELALMWFHGK